MKRLVAAVAGLAWTASCSSFNSMRPATVAPGIAVEATASVASPPGIDAYWFWNFSDCNECNAPVGGTDILLSHGTVRSDSSAYSLGFGVNGYVPYTDVYFQTRGGSSPRGFGGRIGFPALASWMQHRLYARFDRVRSEYTAQWSPALVIHHGNSPNGANPGSFIGLVNSFGLMSEQDGGVSFGPAASIVIGRSQRTSSGVRHGPTWTAFATASLTICFCGRRQWLLRPRGQ